MGIYSSHKIEPVSNLGIKRFAVCYIYIMYDLNIIVTSRKSTKEFKHAG